MDTLGDTLSDRTKGLYSFQAASSMPRLYDAADVGDLERVQVLVKQGADKEKTGGIHDWTPLYIASRNGQLPVVRYLVEQGADMEKASNYGFVSLMGSCYNGSLRVVSFLLEQGANVNKADISGHTSLHYAACRGHLEVAKLLMVYGADLNARDKWGNLPIEMGNRNTEVIKQAIRDEPQRRWEQQPRKRCVDQDQHPSAATSSLCAEQERQGRSADQQQATTRGRSRGRGSG